MSVKKYLRNAIARLLYVLKLTKPDRCAQGQLSIVTFHRVLPENERQRYPFPGLVVTPEELDILLIYFKKYFDCGALATQHDRFLKGEKTVRPLLAITFDDAQYDNYQYARPVLALHNVSASFFVPVAAVENQELLWHDKLGFSVLALLEHGEEGKARLLQALDAAGLSLQDKTLTVSNIVQSSKNLLLNARLHLVSSLVAASRQVKIPDFARLMNFDEITQLAHEGHEIGSHSMTHCMMTECDDSGLAYEVNESRLKLQNRLGLVVSTFCYPNGNSDGRTAQAVAHAGYVRAVTTDWGLNGKDADHFRLRRCDMVAKNLQDSKGQFIPALLAFRMSGFYPGLGA